MRLLAILTVLLGSASVVSAQTAGSCPGPVSNPPTNPKATLRDAMPTNSVPPNCQTPVTVSAYLTTDHSVFAWYSVDGLLAGDVSETQWFTPEGQFYLDARSKPVSAAGNHCFWTEMKIAGTDAAKHTGAWTVNILVNGNVLGTISFTISVVLVNGATTTNDVKGNCSDAPTVTDFLTSDKHVIAVVMLRGTGSAGTLRFEFHDPSDKISLVSSGPITADHKDQCWLATLPIAGKPPAGLPGNWHVKITYQGSAVADLPFTITPLLIQGFATTDQVPSGCADPNYVDFFLTKAPSQKTWILYKAGSAGLLHFEYYAPNGSHFQTSSGRLLADGKVHCQWATLPIAGSKAATLTGLWTVKGYDDSYHLGDLNFTIAPILIENPMTTDKVNGCKLPTAKDAFLTTDPVVYTWFQAKGGRVGDAPWLEWLAPDGSFYQRTNFSKLSKAGDYCFSGKIPIAGAKAASLPGLWTVNIRWNGVIATALKFTIAPVQVDNPVLTVDDVGVGCDVPVSENQFLTTSKKAVVWFRVLNGKNGDVAEVDWLGPDAKNHRTYKLKLSKSGSYFISDSLPIAGNPPAKLTGAWKVSVKWNTKLLFELPFSISTPSTSHPSVAEFDAGYDAGVEDQIALEERSSPAGASRAPRARVQPRGTCRVTLETFVGTDGVGEDRVLEDEPIEEGENLFERREF